jgi:hypothetical protein
MELRKGGNVYREVGRRGEDESDIEAIVRFKKQEGERGDYED